MARAGWFDTETVPLGVFDESGDAGGWFDATALDGTTSNAYTLDGDYGAIALSGTTTGVRALRTASAITRRLHARGDQHGPWIALPAASGRSCFAGTTSALVTQRKLSVSTGSSRSAEQNAGLGRASVS